MGKAAAMALSLAVFLAWEALKPYYAYKSGHWLRSLNNAIVGLFNAAFARLAFAGLGYWALSLAADARFGLLNIVALPSWASIALTMLVLDLWTYWWHRLNHTVNFLWRFHRAHHTDTEMGVTTAYRFHPVELALSSLLRVPLILAFGLKPEGLLWYELILNVSIAFHHANLGIGDKADALVRALFVSPIMHKLHHSVEPREFSSNYSSILSLWDRLFGSWTVTDKPRGIVLGLRVYRDERWQSVIGILLTPFKRSGSGLNPNSPE